MVILKFFRNIPNALKMVIFYGRIIWYVLKCPPSFGFFFFQRWMSHEKLSSLSLPVTQISFERAFFGNISLNFCGANSDAIRQTYTDINKHIFQLSAIIMSAGVNFKIFLIDNLIKKFINFLKYLTLNVI